MNSNSRLVQPVSGSDLLFSYVCPALQTVSPTAQPFLLSLMTQSMMGDAIRPLSPAKSVGFALTDIPF